MTVRRRPRPTTAPPPGRRLFFCGALIAMAAGLTAAAEASPPACRRGDVAMFAVADAVVTADVDSARRWRSGAATIHLVARYGVLHVFKGDIEPGDSVIVTDTCLDHAVPQDRLGYSAVERYCLGGRNLSLTGVRSRDGAVLAEEASGRPLFLRADRRSGAPEPTWLEVPRTSLAGGCGASRDSLAPGDRDRFDRLFATLRTKR